LQKGTRLLDGKILAYGRRAVTIWVDDVKGVAGFVRPWDHVDVVLIRPDMGDNYSDILVQDVKVGAVDQLANERQEKAKLARAVTLEVTTEQAQKILQAGTVGRLSLILRPAAQSEPNRIVRRDDLQPPPPRFGAGWKPCPPRFGQPGDPCFIIQLSNGAADGTAWGQTWALNFGDAAHFPTAGALAPPAIALIGPMHWIY